MPETFAPSTWTDGPAGGTPITAAQLNRIETGVESMDDRTAALESSTAAITTGTVYALNPPTGAAIAANGTTNDAAALQAQLNYVKATWNGGVVQLPAGRTIKLNSGITIPERVQLASDESTILDFSGMSASGTAITIAWTVDGSYTACGFTPLIGVHLTGPGGGVGATSVGISITGVSLRIFRFRVRNFGRGIDVAHTNTWLVSLIGGSIHNCQVCYYNDNVAATANNAGEEMVIDHCALFNSATAIRATGAGVHLNVTNTAIDYCGLFMYALDAWVWFVGCHLESQGGTSGTYLILPAGNTKTSLVACDVIMGAGTTSTLNFLFDPNAGPSNFGNGAAHFSNTKIYAVNPFGGDVTHYSEQLLVFPAGQTSVTYFTPFPTSWCTVDARFIAQSFMVQSGDTLRVSSMNGITGQFTLTAGTSQGSDRWARVTFA